MKKGDFVLIAIILSTVFVFMTYNWLNRSSSETAEGAKIAKIVLDGEVYREVELVGQSETIEILTKNGYDLLQVHDNGIEVIESDCPEKICQDYGFIDKTGDIIVCLPNRMFIEILGSDVDQPEIDALST